MLTGEGELGIAAKADRFLMNRFPKYLDPAMWSKSGWVHNPHFKSWLDNVARQASAVTEQGAKGAIGGFIADPQHPETSIPTGALGGAIPGAGAAIMNSPIGRFLGRNAIPGLASYLAYHGLTSAGLPGGWHTALGSALTLPIAHSMRWFHSPIGRRLRQIGEKLVDETGRVIGEYIAPHTAPVTGYGAGKGQRKAREELEKYD